MNKVVIRQEYFPEVTFDEASDSRMNAEKLIFDTYIEIFEENLKKKKEFSDRSRVIPSISDIYNKLEYDFDTKALDIVLGVKRSDLQHARIAAFLTREKCVYRWSSVVCCQAQMTLFEDCDDYEDTFMLK